MKKFLKTTAIVCSVILGLTTVPMQEFQAETVKETEEVRSENRQENQSVYTSDEKLSEVESLTEDDSELQKENAGYSEVESMEASKEVDTEQIMDGDYEDDPEAGRASGKVDEGFFNQEELYEPSLQSDLTGSAGIVHNGKFSGTTKRSGVDVSSWQGNIDWNQVKASGIEYAFIRVGYRGYSSGSLAKDAKSIQNLQGAKAAGLKVGIYFFSQAINTSEAQEEADYAISIASGYALDLPVVMDYEYASGNDGRLYNAHLSVNTATSIVNAFCERVQNRGYYGMVYANKSMLENQLNASEISSKYLVWLANYTNQTSYGGNYRFWQYSSTGSVPGISGNVDMDVWYDNGTLMGGGYNSSVEVKYSTHVQNEGWQNTVSDGVISGSVGKGLRLEAVKIGLGQTAYKGQIYYSTHVQNIGWQNWVSNNQIAGTQGQFLRVEAIKIKLTDEMAKHYDVYYRVHAQNIGWMGWTKNGNPAGTEGYNTRLEALQIVIVAKNASAPGNTNDSYRCTKVRYVTQVQNIGWGGTVKDGNVSGSTGKSLRLETIKVNLDNQKYDGNIEYQSHIQNAGWENSWKKNGEESGTVGKALRLEAIRIKLTGEMSNHYDVYYRVHAQDIGWMGWAKNGASAGTEGMSKRVEAIQIVLVDKGGSAPGSTSQTFIKQ